MRLALLATLTPLLWSAASAQTDDPRANRLSNAVDSAGADAYLTRQVAEAARDAITELSHLHEGDTKDVVQYFADKAKAKIVGVDSTMKHAVDDAGWADWWADQAGCSDGSGNAKEATASLEAARATFDDAYSKLLHATGDEDVEALIGYLNSAYRDLIDGVTKLTEANDQLNEAVKAMHACL